MRIKYFEDTDTALLEFTENDVWETRGISESIVVDVDRDGNLVSLTIEHAGEKANIRNFSFESVVTKSA